VQFLAGLGYAVLQVNFRGSEGYGRSFREAAEGNYGSLIEDDIDAAISQVLAEHPLDPNRICILGSSYGGYSALIASLRWPERFRCAASIAGVTDRLLRFSASDGAQSAEGRAELEKLMGDPNTDPDALQRASPVYRHAELKLPVLLAHGRADRRVDAEHSRRLERVLSQTGKPPVTLYFDTEGHGLSQTSNQQQLWTSIAAFLQQHLGAKATAPPK
jgi:dipeptidyl aminopeptidase/acylaminoacyl peptidase